MEKNKNTGEYNYTKTEKISIGIAVMIIATLGGAVCIIKDKFEKDIDQMKQIEEKIK